MIRSKSHLTGILGINEKELLKIIANLDKFYYMKEELKRKKDGSLKLYKGKPKARIMYPSTGRLKIVQKSIKAAILSQIKLDDCVFGGVKGKCNITNAKAHKGKKNKFVTDLKDFFPSVTPKMVYRGLIHNGFSPDVARILTKLTTYKFQVPQGAPTSTHITNIAMASLDSELNRICKEHGITYTRYVDDLSFSCQKCFQFKISDLLNVLSKYGLKLSHRKTGYYKHKTVVTGVVVGNNMGVTREFKQKLDSPSKFKETQVRGHLAYANRVNSF